MMLKAKTLVHTATVDSTHISISANGRIKADRISNVVGVIFPNIVLCQVGWLCGALAEMLICLEAVDHYKNAIMLPSLISAAPK